MKLLFGQACAVFTCLIGFGTISVGLLGGTAPALADVPWIADGAPCDSVAGQIDRFQSIVRQGGKLTDQQRGEFSVILHEACGSRFASCEIPICRSLAERALSDPERAGPLAWLNAPLDCKALQQEVKSRYGALGAFSKLPESKRIEVGYVLDLVCSPRFTACGFKQCSQTSEANAAQQADNLSAGVDAMTAEIADRLAIAAEQLGSEQLASDQPTSDQPTSEEPTPIPTQAEATTQAETDPPETEGTETGATETPEDLAVQQALVEYERLVQDDLANRQALMEIAVEAEKRERKKWNRIGNPEELAIVEERRKRSKSMDNENEADRGRNKPYYSDYFKSSGSGRSGPAKNRPKTQSKPRSSKSQGAPPTQPRRETGGNQGEPIVF